MVIFRILAVLAVAGLIGCGTDKERERATQQDKKEFEKKLKIVQDIATTTGSLPAESATEKDFDKLSTADLASYKENLETFSKNAGDLLAIDSRGHVRIVNKVTGKSLRPEFEKMYKTSTYQLGLVNARLQKRNALDDNGRVKPEALTTTPPSTPNGKKPAVTPAPKKKAS